MNPFTTPLTLSRPGGWQGLKTETDVDKTANANHVESQQQQEPLKPYLILLYHSLTVSPDLKAFFPGFLQFLCHL